jgi:hypothetical protein
MTGFIAEEVPPMSKMTIGAIADLGYTVDYKQADNFCAPPKRRLLRGTQKKEKIAYGNDIRKHDMVILEEVEKFRHGH